MNKVKLCIMCASLVIVGKISAMEIVEYKRGRISTQYHRMTDKLSNHKGKVGLAVGVIGTTIVTKVFRKEIDMYVKPLIKNIFKRTYNFFKRVFKRSEPSR